MNRKEIIIAVLDSRTNQYCIKFKNAEVDVEMIQGSEDNKNAIANHILSVFEKEGL